MKSVKILNKASLAALAIASLCTSQQGMAHTTIQHNNGISSTISVPAAGSGTVYNNIVIGHGCTDPNDATKHFPVIAQSVLFPTVSPIITTGSGAGTISALTLGDLLQSSATNTTSVTTLAGLPQLIQNNSAFTAQKEKTDASGNVIGFEGTKGKVDPTLHALIPFRFGAVFFKPTACVKTLKVNIAIADICKLKFKTGGPTEGQANTWFPNKTPKFTHDIDGVMDKTQKNVEPQPGAAIGTRNGSPAELTFTNAVTTDATNCPNGFTDYAIWPSEADIDANIIIKKYWGK